MSRLVPLPRADWADDVQPLLHGQLPNADHFLEPGSPTVPGVLGLFAHHPGFTAPWLAMLAAADAHGVLSARDRELLILRVSARSGCRYEWEQHVKRGRGAGLGDDEIAALAGDLAAYAWGGRDLLLLGVADELLDRCTLGDSTWNALASALGDREVLEVLFTVGSYLGLALVLNSVDLQPEG